VNSRCSREQAWALLLRRSKLAESPPAQHLLLRILSGECKRLAGRIMQSRFEFLFMLKQHRHAFVIDGQDERLQPNRRNQISQSLAMRLQARSPKRLLRSSWSDGNLHSKVADSRALGPSTFRGLTLRRSYPGNVGAQLMQVCTGAPCF